MFGKSDYHLIRRHWSRKGLRCSTRWGRIRARTGCRLDRLVIGLSGTFVLWAVCSIRTKCASMGSQNSSESQKLPWYLWPLAPIALASSLFVMIPFGVLALLSIPYFVIYPDHHAHQYDFEGTDHQRKRLSQWRAQYGRMNVFGRLERAYRTRRRRRKRR